MFFYEKRLITSFFLANTIDSALTSILLTQDGWRELNLLAFSKFAQGQGHEVIILKLAYTAVLIGAYALAKAINSRWEYPLERALWLGSLLVWSVQFWNAANVVATLAQNTKF